jgi:SNF2 family DNA or RNA helicase
VKPGRITIVGSMITVTCQPHVAIMLRRVFGGVQRKGAGSFELSATPPNANLLEWFRAQFPLDLEPASATPFRVLVAAEKRKQLAIAEIEEPGYVPRQFDLALPPREYQRVAADLALRTGRLLIADMIGLGKTVSGICTLVAEGALPAVIVTMTHLPIQWHRELARFVPGLRVHRVKSGKPYSLKSLKFDVDAEGVRYRPLGRLPDVVVLSYSKLDGWVDTLAPMTRTIILDECQELRIAGSNKYKAAKALCEAARTRIGLSASPIYNYGAEIFSVLDALSPGVLGSRGEFYQEWCGGGGGDPTKVGVKDPIALGSYLREAGLMIRRTRKDVGRELPPLTIVRHVVECDTRRIDEAAADVAEIARRVLARAGSNFELMQWSGEIDLRMRQATGLGKAAGVADLVRLLVESGENVVLYGWHRAVYEIWKSAFERAGISYALYTGEENARAKVTSLKRFIAGEAKVLIISLRAGAGIDGLQKVNKTVVIGELDWSPMVHGQNIGRSYRDGQLDPVFAYFPVAEQGSDPAIEDVLGLKEAQATGIISPEDAGIPQFVGGSPEHVRRLAEEVIRRRGLHVGAGYRPEAVV